MEYSLARLSLFQALAWDPIYQEHKKHFFVRSWGKHLRGSEYGNA